MFTLNTILFPTSSLWVAHHFIGQLKLFLLPVFQPFPSPVYIYSTLQVGFLGFAFTPSAASMIPLHFLPWLRALSSLSCLMELPPAPVSLVSFLHLHSYPFYKVLQYLSVLSYDYVTTYFLINKLNLVTQTI